MATLIRAPLVQNINQRIHKADIFQPVNLLCSTLGLAVSIALPLFNPDASAWAQVQHPSNLYINSDTSFGVPRSLKEIVLPIGDVAALSSPHQLRVVSDTTQDTPLVLLTIPSLPISTPSHLAPVKFWFQPQDSSESVPKTLLNEALLPAGSNRLLQTVQTPDLVRSVVDTSFGISKSLRSEPLPAARGYQETFQYIYPPVTDTSNESSLALLSGFVPPPVPIVIIDTHDGADKIAKRKKEQKEQLRKDIEQAFNLALGLPEESVPHKVASKYLQADNEFDFESLSRNIRDLNILNSLFQKQQKQREDEEEEILMLGLLQ